MAQLELHKKIDELTAKSPTKIKPEDVLNLISVNFDARQYFFFKADERWLNWLWENGFLDVIKQKAKDLTRDSYQTPELNYLIRMTEKVPDKVVSIMIDVPISPNTFNPGVVYRFIEICSKLPAEQLARIVKKIRDEQWILLMDVFNQWGFEYEKMFKTLAKAGDYTNLLILAEALLSVRTKEEIKKQSRYVAKTFYISDFSNTKVFKYLANIPDEYAEDALALTIKVMRKIVNLSERTKSNSNFKLEDKFSFLDINFFTLEIGKEKPLSNYEAVKELAATIKVLLERLISKNCDKPDYIRLIYQKYINSLPDSRAMWQLRLFALSLCPKVFKSELKNAFFRLFKVKNHYYEIICAEYEQSLKKCFFVLDDSDKREYIKRVMEYFNKPSIDKDDQNFRKEYGSKILSLVSECLNEDEKNKAKELGFTIDQNYEPKPSIGNMQFGYVQPTGPISSEEFNKLPIKEIAKKLRKEWSPENLRKKYKNDNFLRPRNAEGVGDLLRNDVSKRLQDYVNNAYLFFERDVLDQHYTYSFLCGIKETIKNNLELAFHIDWQGIINLFLDIKKSGEENPFDKNQQRDLYDEWLANWNAVHSEIADILQELLKEHNDRVIIDFSKYRNNVLEILNYLLSYPGPTPEDEEKDEVTFDPFTLAINSIRGRAFQAFILFVLQDGKIFPENNKIKISLDVKKVYEEVLEKENTRAIMFMFGYYLPTFYYRDRKWILHLLPKIFPKEKQKKYLYLAAWEGYLTNNLFVEMFFEDNIQNLYKRGIDLTETNYPNQKHFRDPDKGLAVHLALAFVHFPKFNFKNDLFKKFWEIKNLKRQKEFISFIGRYSISREEANKWIKYNKINIAKLKKFWEWVLENTSGPEILSGFGYWINPNEEVLDDKFVIEKMAQTMGKSDGKIDWDYGLLKRITIFAKTHSKDTLKIISHYFLDSNGNLNSNRQMPILYEEEIKNAMKIIYNKGDKKTKQEVIDLINKLIEKGSSKFWYLEEVIK